jgi:hypothetical protein
MESFFSHKDAYVVLGFLAVTMPMAVAVVAYFWYKVRSEEVRTGLKRAMIERGMSGEEIRIVIEAGTGGAADAAEGSAALSAGGQRV